MEVPAGGFSQEPDALDGLADYDADISIQLEAGKAHSESAPDQLESLDAISSRRRDSGQTSSRDSVDSATLSGGRELTGRTSEAHEFTDADLEAPVTVARPRTSMSASLGSLNLKRTMKANERPAKGRAMKK